MADDVEELHEFAAKIGLRRSWYQPKSTPHYDVTYHYRQKAVEAGAAELDRAGIVALCRLYRERGTAVTE